MMCYFISNLRESNFRDLFDFEYSKVLNLRLKSNVKFKNGRENHIFSIYYFPPFVRRDILANEITCKMIQFHIHESLVRLREFIYGIIF